MGVVDQFQLCENTITGIVGINGAGKSTLFKAICGLIKSDAGDISLFGSAVDDLSVEQKEKIEKYRKYDGDRKFCFQYFWSLLLYFVDLTQHLLVI